ncbi:MAG TPA: hypothetical protein VF050_07035 [Moraxellaceae bacterium]
MSRLFKTLALATLLAAPLAALADEPAAAPAAKKAASQDKDNLYVGIGLFQDMINANVEVVTGWGNFMVRAGRFHNIGEGFATNMSWRRALTTDDAHGSGYYIGLFGGQVSGDVLDGETYQRIGGGGEMGYHWVGEYTRAELTVGLGAAQQEKNDVTGNELTAEPTIFFSFNIALGY